MRCFFSKLIRAALWFSLVLIAQTLVKGQPLLPGIRFHSGNFTTALAAAQAAHKPLFVEIYLTGCPHCAALAPILEEKQVGDFFNTNFVSWKVEASSAEAISLQKEKRITFPEYPFCLFFDSTGTLIHVSALAEQTSKDAFIQEVISMGRTALNPTQRASGYAARFGAGDRDLAFLVNYGKYSLARSDKTQLHEISDLLGKTLQPDQIKSQEGIYCLQQLIDDVDNPAATYFFNHLSEFKAIYADDVVKVTGERVIFRALYGSAGGQYSAQKILQIRDYLMTLGVSPQDATARTLIKELDAYLREKNTRAAVQRFNEYRRQTPTTGVAEYAYLMRYFNEKAQDTTYLQQMPVWAADGLKSVKPNQENTQPVADLYYELAVAYQKLGQKAEALKNAQQGLSVAKKANLAVQKYENQVATLK